MTSSSRAAISDIGVAGRRQSRKVVFKNTMSEFGGSRDTGDMSTVTVVKATHESFIYLTAKRFGIVHVGLRGTKEDFNGVQVRI